MNWQDNLKSMRMESTECIPVSVGILPSAWIKYREKLDAIVKRHPVLFGEDKNKKDYDAVSGTYVAGAHVDAWGCVWENVHHGQEAIVTKHPVPTREDVCKLKAPDKDMGLPHGCMYLRLADLRGFEELMTDFAEEPPELQMLIDIVLKYNLRQCDIWLGKQTEKGPMFSVGDDLGMQHSLAIGPEKWRKYLKPCFMQLYQPVKQAGHYVYMHTDGMIYEIIPDLIEIGLDVLNPIQCNCVGMDPLDLKREFGSKLAFMGGVDTQGVLPQGTVNEVRAATSRLLEGMCADGGGYILAASHTIPPETPLANIFAMYEVAGISESEIHDRAASLRKNLAERRNNEHTHAEFDASWADQL